MGILGAAQSRVQGTPMPVREILVKAIQFAVITAVIVGAGILVIAIPHGYRDNLMNLVLGGVIILTGGITGLFGAASVLRSILDARAKRREATLHVTPRNGPPTTPPPWGMGDVGRPGVIKVDRSVGTPRGGVRVVGLPIRHLDVPLVVGGLLVWTLVALILLAPR